jgi:hypothetical protein
MIQLYVSKRFLVNITFLLCFFPWLRVFPVHAETQPIAAIVALLILCFWGIKRDPLSLTLLWFLLCLGGYYLISLALRIESWGPVSLHTVSYALPILVFLALFDKLGLLSVRFYWVAFWLWLMLGVVQYFDCFSAVKPILDGLLGHIIGRYKSVQLGGSRGVLFWGPEPATAAKGILLLLATGFYFYSAGRMRKRALSCIVAGTLGMTLMNKSGTGGLIYGLFLLMLVIGYLVGVLRRRGFIRLSLHVAVILLVGLLCYRGFLWAQEHGYRSRFSYLADRAFCSLTTGRPPLRYMLIQAGGDRFPLVYIGYASLVRGYPMGHGTGGWLTDMSDMIKSCRRYLFNYRVPLWKPYSYGSAVAFDMGFPGLFLLLMFLLQCAMRIGKDRCCPEIRGIRYALCFTGIFHILLLDMISIPTPWLLLAYVAGTEQKTVIVQGDVTWNRTGS